MAETQPVRAMVAPVTPLQQNCTTVWCTETRRAAVIDPGGDVPRILQGLKQQDLTVDAIWLTHGHLDHAGGAAELRDALGGVPIVGPQREDQWLLNELEETGAKWGLLGCRNVSPDRWLDEGDTVRLGETEWEVFHTPGHTPGHVIFFHRPSRFAQVGDVLFKGSVGRTDFPRSSHEQLIESVVTKLWPLGDDVTFVCGHGPMSTFGAERRSNPFVSDLAVESSRL